MAFQTNPTEALTTLPLVAAELGSGLATSGIASVTAVAIVSNVLTVTAVNNFSSGATVQLAGTAENGLLGVPLLNGVIFHLISATPTAFTASFTFANYANAADTGTATPTLITSINEMIADLSQEFLQRCGVFSVSTAYASTESYNGSGGNTLALRQYYTAITSVVIGSATIIQSTSPTQYGWVLDSTGRFLMLRGWTFFQRGILNVVVTGTAGNSGVPGDIQRAMTRWVAIELKRKDSINVRSLGLSGGGSTTYLQDDQLPPDILRCIRNHSLVSL